MKLCNLAKVQSGHISRGNIEPLIDGSHFLVRARDVDANSLTYSTNSITRFNPNLSQKDWILEKDDILFMARGARNFSVLLNDILEPALAAACFFIIRTSHHICLPPYLWWYLNQTPVEDYLHRESGRGVHMPVVRRAVLENMEIPVPPLETQQKIVMLDMLMRKEQKLLNKMAEKRKELTNAVCLKAALTTRK